MDKRVLGYLRKERMASLMNATKWRELALRLETIGRGRLPIRVKCVLDASASGFACLDWEWVKNGDTSIIEWIEVDPVLRTPRGRLVPDSTEDLTDLIRCALMDVGVPYSEEGGFMRVWGHVRPDAQPVFA